MKMKKRSSLFIFIIATASLLSSIFIFVPADLYPKNSIEMDIGLGSFLIYSVSLASIIFILMLALAWPMKPVHRERLVSVVLGLNILVYLQSRFLVWGYGELDGGSIPWKEMWFFGLIDTAVWIGLLFASIWYFKTFFKHALFLSISLFILQYVTIAYQSYENPRMWHEKLPYDIPNDFYDLSAEQTNVLFFVMDGFEHRAFEMALAQDPSLQQIFDGFRIFQEHVGTYKSTAPTIPLYMSGQIYRGEVPFLDYLTQDVRKSNISKLLSNRGYSSATVTLGHFCPPHYPSCLDIAHIVKAETDDSWKFKLAKTINLSLFKLSPHFVRKIVHNDHRWLFQNLEKQKNFGSPRLQESLSLLKRLKKYWTANNPKPVYRFIHVLLPHGPFVLNQNCEQILNKMPEKERYVQQSQCTIKLLGGMFEKLKELGAYDNSLIIVAADHGSRLKDRLIEDHRSFNLASRAYPVFLMKDKDSRGALREVSEATSGADVPRLLLKSLGLYDSYSQTIKDRLDKERYFYVFDISGWDFLKEGAQPNTTRYLVPPRALDWREWRVIKD